MKGIRTGYCEEMTMELFLNIMLIIAALFFIALCVVAFGAIRLWKRINQAQAMQAALLVGALNKERRK